MTNAVHLNVRIESPQRSPFFPAVLARNSFAELPKGRDLREEIVPAGLSDYLNDLFPEGSSPKTSFLANNVGVRCLSVPVHFVFGAFFFPSLVVALLCPHPHTKARRLSN